MTTKLITPATDGQKKQVSRLIEEVGEYVLKSGISKEDAQRLLERGGEFKGELVRLLIPRSAFRMPQHRGRPGSRCRRFDGASRE
jgi:hypothetical protein